MQITNCGRGVHTREVKGIDRLKALPNNWYAFTNLDLATGFGRSREIDVIMVTEHIIFLIDLKDWNGRIESSEGNWLHNGCDTGPSPVAKIHANAKDILRLLTNQLRSRTETRGCPVPKIVGLVVVTGKADLTGLAPTECSSVFKITDFVDVVTNRRRETFGNVAQPFLAYPLTEPNWKDRLSKFFNVRKDGPFKPGKRRYERYIATSEGATFRHPEDVFREYEAEEESTPLNLGTLRVWDFTRCRDTRFQTEDGRAEIAGREQKIFYYLRDRSEAIENSILVPKAADSDHGVDYWEVYDRRRRLKRLTDFVATETANLTVADRIELARQMISRVAALHAADAAHLDLGQHSIWLEAPSTVKLSHLMVSKIPEFTSLGVARYQFLSSVTVPEDVLGNDRGPKRKDVFLIGVAVHHIVFGQPPRCHSAGNPPEWDPSADPDGQHGTLHSWFEQSLEFDPEGRFIDAASALEAFNAATASRPTPHEVIKGLEGFRGAIRSQRHLVNAYPDAEVVLESDRVDIWRSECEGAHVLVKVWKRAALGDQTREGARILDFLSRARDLQLSPLPGCAAIKDVIWLGDAIALVQECIPGDNLSKSLASASGIWTDPTASLTFLSRLAETVIGLHERGVAHGDLKPDNIIVKGDGDPDPILVDLIDFAPVADGELISSAYAPETGSREQRDNFAITKIAEEVLAVCSVDSEAGVDIAHNIDLCRTKMPENGTLLPFLESIRRALSPRAKTERISVSLSIRQARTGPVFPDEGVFYLRVHPESPGFFIRGICEEIVVFLDNMGVPISMHRRSVDQGKIARVSKHEFKSIPADITVTSSAFNDFSGLQLIVDDPDLQDAMKRRLKPEQSESLEQDDADEREDLGDIAGDALAEEISATVTVGATDGIDVPSLWRKLIDVESELTTEGLAQGESFYDRNLKRHIVPFELSGGTFDFDRNDTVGVEKLDQRGNWRRIGELDTARAKPDVIVIDPTDYASPGQSGLVKENERLRFSSHFEVQSLRRREGAIGRILERRSRASGLIDVFDSRKSCTPSSCVHNLNAELVERYNLNADQKQALGKLVQIRPLGLLQGPPGTGKTKFIAALTHYALATGLAQNVLLASQSHEAVNNAAESVLDLFRNSGGQPSILRVGAEGVVSDRLLPFHTDRVELLFKDRLRAEMRERFRIVGRALGLTEDLVDDIVFVESQIRPVAERIFELVSNHVSETNRLNGLRQTLETQLKHLGLSEDIAARDVEPAMIVDMAVQALLERREHRSANNAANVAKLQTAVKIAHDFVSSASTAQRSFEPFLAGTRHIVAGTCVGLGRPSLGLTDTPFDLVIVDEAARCTASELSVPIQAGRWIVLVGDHAQLEPLHKAEVVNKVATLMKIPKSEIVRSDFERVFSAPYGRAAGVRLKTQYRMLPPIGQLISDTFYSDLSLKHGRTEPVISLPVFPDDLNHPITWVATDSLGDSAFESPAGKSRVNSVEADIVLRLLKRWCDHEPFYNWLATQNKYPHGIGIICMYAAQRDLIRTKLQRLPMGETLRRNVKIDTVDSYQGKENPIVLLSLVRNNADGPQKCGIATIREGFLTSDNRINVALSRSMDRLVIIGANRRWRPDGPIDRIARSFDTAVQADAAFLVDET